VVSLGQSSIPADGFYIVGKETFTLDGATLDKVIPTGFNLENSDNLTVLLVWNFTGASGDDLDTNDDGTLDATPWETVIDSVGIVETTAIPPETGDEYVYSATTCRTGRHVCAGPREVLPDDLDLDDRHLRHPHRQRHAGSGER
jgi:hypothetical protein